MESSFVKGNRTLSLLARKWGARLPAAGEETESPAPQRNRRKHRFADAGLRAINYHPNVNEKTSTPGSRNSISNVASLIVPSCRMS